MAGRVGRPHGRDGSFYVDAPAHPLGPGTVVTIAGAEAPVERRAGTDERPIVRTAAAADRDGAARLRGEALLVDAESEPAPGEWPAADLVRCRVPGIGRVRRVVPGPSCDVLEVGDEGVLIPFIADAIRTVEPDRGLIEVDRRFLGLPEDVAGPEASPVDGAPRPGPGGSEAA